MADEAPRTEPLTPDADGPAPGDTGRPRPKPEPAIRTMRSDISEFLKKEKPSLISLLARQAQWDEYRPLRPVIQPWFLAGAGAFLLIAGLWLAWWFFSGGSNALQPTAPQTLGQPYFRFDATTEITISATPQAFRSAISSPAADPAGSLTRLAIRIRGNGGADATPDLPELLALAEARLPAALVESAAAEPQLFRYRARDGRGELGVAVEVRNPGRALESLLTAEPSLPGNLTFLFSGALPPSSLTPFEDITYRNISLRFLRAADGTGRDFGYLLFPAKRLIVMATSEEALDAIIDRLFAER
ncbi:MAG: hypothetical protein HY474_00900 [Candidatus Sungbacteria bacterium]|uniref:Uncharacterized protein n=1 Tax=Candidatus Sungiibacteriota bacterium TaxID=2750080 RepID=A0A932YVG2_9BACT|nr:hypothetical protein [Candidatus Sungbacteria bacterium]